jgi:hypothetical protein
LNGGKGIKNENLESYQEGLIECVATSYIYS